MTLAASAIQALFVLAGAADGGAPNNRPAAPKVDLKLLEPLPVGSRTAEPQEIRLERLADGSGDLIYETSGFVALVKPDGSVVFEDKRVQLNPALGPLSLLWPRRLREGETVLQRALRQMFWHPTGARPQGSLEDVIRGAMGQRPGSRARQPTAAQAEEEASAQARSPFFVPPFRNHADPREVCTRTNSCFIDNRGIMVGISGIVDVTDELMRLHGQDPYRYEKARFLAATVPLRTGMAARQRARSLAEAQRTLPDELDAIANDPRFSPAMRRSIIEALRDEIDSSVPGAAEMRAKIDAFLRARFGTER